MYHQQCWKQCQNSHGNSGQKGNKGRRRGSGKYINLTNGESQQQASTGMSKQTMTPDLSPAKLEVMPKHFTGTAAGKVLIDERTQQAKQMCNTPTQLGTNSDNGHLLYVNDILSQIIHASLSKQIFTHNSFFSLFLIRFFVVK